MPNLPGWHSGSPERHYQPPHINRHFPSRTEGGCSATTFEETIVGPYGLNLLFLQSAAVEPKEDGGPVPESWDLESGIWLLLWMGTIGIDAEGEVLGHDSGCLTFRGGPDHGSC